MKSDIWDALSLLIATQRHGLKLDIGVQCSVCEQGFGDNQDHLIAFYCCHYFHSKCLDAEVIVTNSDQEKKSISTEREISLVYSRHSDAIVPVNRDRTVSCWVNAVHLNCPLC